MIGLVDCHFSYRGPYEERAVLVGATLTVEPGERVAILARSGEGKSTVMRLLSGLEEPQRGRVLRDAGLPWLLGGAGAFHPALTGEENARILADLVNEDADRVSAYTKIFSGLGEGFYRPVLGYSGGMRGQLGMALSYALPVTTYLADDKIGTGDATFREKCEEALRQKLDQGSGLLMLTRNVRLAKVFCDRFGVLRGGKIVMCRNSDEAEALFGEEQEDYADLEELVESLYAS